MQARDPLTGAGEAADRSAFVTILGWLLATAGLLLTPISFISLMMILVGGHGTNTVEPLGFLTVVVLPPASVLAGIGLVRRWRWSWLFAVAGLLSALVWNAAAMLIPTQPPASEFAAPPGVSFALTALAAALLSFFLTPAVRREFRISRGMMGRAAAGAAGRVWAIRANAQARAAERLTAPPPGPLSPRGQFAAILFILLLFFGVAAGMTWLVASGLETGEVPLATTRSTHRHPVFRADDPTLFWGSMAIYAFVGAASLVLGLGLGYFAWRGPGEDSHASPRPPS